MTTKTKTTTHKEEAKTETPKTKSIREILEALKAQVLQMESSSSNGDVRESCRNIAALIDSYFA